MDEVIDVLESELRMHKRSEEILARVLPALINKALTSRRHIRQERGGWLMVNEPVDVQIRLNAATARVQFRDEPAPHYLVSLGTCRGAHGHVRNDVAFVLPEAEMDVSSPAAWNKYLEALASRMATAIKATYERWGAGGWTHFAEGWPDPITDSELKRLLQ